MHPVALMFLQDMMVVSRFTSAPHHVVKPQNDAYGDENMLEWCRAARVVAWLESLAGQALDDEDDAVRRAGGSAGRFAPDEGLWKETRIRIAAGVPQKPGERPACSSRRLAG